MTFALAMVTHRLAFAAADRLYSGVDSMKGFPAMKIARLETSDGHGLITYAGAGARSGGKPFEVSAWIESVLRGVNRTQDQTLLEIAAAAEEQGLDKHAPGHTFGYAGFVNGTPRVSTITSAPQLEMRQRDGTSPMAPKGAARFEVTHFNLHDRAHRSAIVLGSGAKHFPPFAELEMIARQASRAKTKEAAVERLCAWFVRINREISAKVPATVGPEAVCAWAFAKGGGGHLAYGADGRLANSTGTLPSISRGMAMTQLVAGLMALMRRKGPPTEAGWASREELDELARSIDERPQRKF